MNILKKYLKAIILLVLFILSILPFYFKEKKELVIHNTPNENFDVTLLSYNTIDKSLNYIDSCYLKENFQNTLDTQSYVNCMSTFIKNRFYHGLSSYNINDNWISYLASKFLWSHFSAIVIPNHILKYPEALCSQQNIVFIELLRRKGINYRTVGLGTVQGPGHYLIEVWYNNNWHLYDVDLEPNWSILNNNHKSLSQLLLNKDELYQIYDQKIQSIHLDTLIKNISYSEVNQSPAKKMFWFHYLTYIITCIIPFLIFALLFRQFIFLKKK